MWHCSKAHHNPSLIIESTIWPFPIRSPSRTRGSRYGQLLIDSMPPATATSMSPTRMPWSASITALRPEPHTLLIGSAATRSGSPPCNAACRAGFCPLPAATTLPMMHSSTIAGSMPARRTASATTSAPSWGAVKSLSAPRNFPVGVRTALTITDSRMTVSRFADGDGRDRLLAKQRLQPREDDRRGADDFAGPCGARRLDEQHATPEAHRRHAFDGRAACCPPGEVDLAGRERRCPHDLRERPGQGLLYGPHRLILTSRYAAHAFDPRVSVTAPRRPVARGGLHVRCRSGDHRRARALRRTGGGVRPARCGREIGGPGGKARTAGTV